MMNQKDENPSEIVDLQTCCVCFWGSSKSHSNVTETGFQDVKIIKILQILNLLNYEVK